MTLCLENCQNGDFIADKMLIILGEKSWKSLFFCPEAPEQGRRVELLGEMQLLVAGSEG